MLLTNGLNRCQVKQTIVVMVDGQAGKGSKYRKVNWKKWDEGWEKAFPKKKTTKKVKDKNKGKSKNE